MSRAAFIFRSAFGSSIRAILRMVGRASAFRSWLSLMPNFSLAVVTQAFSSLVRYISACGKLIRFSSQSTIANNIIAQRLSTVNKLSPPRLLHATGRRRRGAWGVSPLVPSFHEEAPEGLRYLVFFLAPGPRPFRVGPAGLRPRRYLRRVLVRGEGFEILVSKARGDFA